MCSVPGDPGDGLLQSSPHFHQLPPAATGPAPGGAATCPCGGWPGESAGGGAPARGGTRVIVRAAQAALVAELHVADAARGAGQLGQLVGQRPGMMTDSVLQDRRQVQLLLLDQLLLLGEAGRGASPCFLPLTMSVRWTVAGLEQNWHFIPCLFPSASPESPFFQLANPVAQPGRVLVRLTGHRRLQLLSQLNQFRSASACSGAAGGAPCRSAGSRRECSPAVASAPRETPGSRGDSRAGRSCESPRT